jgi:hypothetical protein
MLDGSFTPVHSNAEAVSMPSKKPRIRAMRRIATSSRSGSELITGSGAKLLDELPARGETILGAPCQPERPSPHRAFDE